MLLPQDNLVTHAVEPIVQYALIVGAGIILVWFARTILDVRDDTRKIKIALWGDPDERLPNGMKRELRDLIAKVQTLDGTVKAEIADKIAWRAENTILVTNASNKFHDILLGIQRQLERRKTVRE